MIASQLAKHTVSGFTVPLLLAGAAVGIPPVSNLPQPFCRAGLPTVRAR